VDHARIHTAQAEPFAALGIDKRESVFAEAIAEFMAAQMGTVGDLDYDLADLQALSGG
jgi:hypothetical protein